MASWDSGYVTDVPYVHGFFRAQTPSFLSFVSLANGVLSPDINRPFTWAELGCGQGVTATLLAAANPHSAFYATDFNPAHIVSARALASEAGLGNIHFYEESFAEFADNPDLPEFDFVSLHGIYSWVPAEERKNIIAFIRRKLKPGGLAYVSYNALPGQASIAPIRHLMLMADPTSGRPSLERVRTGVDFLGDLQRVKAKFLEVSGWKGFGALTGESLRYLAHEYLTRSWTPFYHSEVASELSEAKLTYLGSAALTHALDEINLNPEQQLLLAEIALSSVRETVRDFILNTSFRSDVFVKGHVPLSAAAKQKAWLDLPLALTTPQIEIPETLTGAAGARNLRGEEFITIVTRLEEGPLTVQHLLSDAGVAPKNIRQLQQAIVALVGAGHVQPALEVHGCAARAKSTQTFNTAIMRRALSSRDIDVLASPVTGGGVFLDRIDQLFLGAHGRDALGILRLVESALSNNNDNNQEGRLRPESNKNGPDPLDTWARWEIFKRHRLPVLTRLGIEPPGPGFPSIAGLSHDASAGTHG